MDTTQILYTLRDVKSFLGVFPSDTLSRSVTHSDMFIMNANPHTDKRSHRLAVHFLPKSSSALFFDPYRTVKLVPDITAFIQRNFTVWDYNRTQMQGLTHNVWGIYCCLFALYINNRFTAKQFVGQFDRASADQQIVRAFASEFGSSRGSGGGQCSSSFL